MEIQRVQVTSDQDSYPPKSAGRLVSTAFPVVSDTATIGTVEQYLLQNAKRLDSMNYVYVVDAAGQLRGVISIKEIFRQPKSAAVSALMETKVFSVTPDTSQEVAAYRAMKHKLKEIPVVEHDGRLLGVIPHDVILSLVYREARDDLLKMAGIRHRGAVMDDIFQLSIVESLSHRLPWLIIGLVGGVAVARIIGLFEATLERNLILAAFIPLIVYMSDAVGTQMEAFIIRDLAINPGLRFRPYFLRQFSILLIISLITSAMLFLVGALSGSLRLGLVLAVALGAAILSSVFTGLLVPFLFSRWRLDPADASGPIATILQDLVSVLIYFAVASVLL